MDNLDLINSIRRATKDNSTFNDDFLFSLEKRLADGQELTEKQETALWNIYLRFVEKL